MFRATTWLRLACLSPFRQLKPIILQAAMASSHKPVRETFTEFLLSDCVIVANRTPLRLLELEIYHYNNRDHSDPFAHCDELQSRWGRFYFHKMSGAYKGGTYKGLDITFGGIDAHREGCDTRDGGPLEFGGILVRAIQVLSSGEIIEGPSLTVDKILSLTKMTQVKDLVEAIGGDESPAWYPAETWSQMGEKFGVKFPLPSAYKADPPLLYITTWDYAISTSLVKGEKWKVDLVVGPRVGLNLPAKGRIRSESSPTSPARKRKGDSEAFEKTGSSYDYCSYVGRGYRFISKPAAIKKGRQLIAIGMHLYHQASPSVIEQKTGMKGKTITGYLDAFEQGTKMDADGFFGKKCSTAEDNAQCLGAAYGASQFKDKAEESDGAGPSKAPRTSQSPKKE